MRPFGWLTGAEWEAGNAAWATEAALTRIDVALPEDIAKHLQDEWRNLSRGALEAIASEGYRDGSLTRDQVGRLLGLSFWDTEAFLKQRHADLGYTDEDLDRDRDDIERASRG